MDKLLQDKILARHILSKHEQNFSALLGALDVLGNAQNRLKFIHVAGTNGKGSVCEMLASALTSAGYKTGLFTSPHLLSPTERFKIDGKEIPLRTLKALIRKTLKAEQKTLNYFEIMTVCAFLYFAAQKCDYVVLETGLGGLHDATNIVRPEVSVITSISLDHKDVLGGTIKKIAAQKAGIIKPNIPCVTGSLPEQAAQVVHAATKNNKAPLYAKNNFFKTLGFYWDKNITLLKGPDGKMWELGILGSRQYINASAAYQTLKFLGIADRHIKEGFKKAKLKARFEVKKQGGKTYIFDGGHNIEAAQSFIDLYKKSPYKKNAVLIYGAMKNKDYKKILTLYKKHFKNYLFWQFDLKNGVSAEELAKIVKGNTQTAKDIKEVKKLSQKYQTIIYAGSFYQYKHF